MAHINIALFSRSLCSEVAEMFHGGLTELGHTSAIQMFTLNPATLNIVMPAALFPPDALGAVPRGTIFYNVEDMEQQAPDKRATIVEIMRRGFPFWEFSRKNLAWFDEIGFPGAARHVALGYSATIDRIVRRPWEERKIDVLFYGHLNQRRVDIIARLMSTSLTVGVFRNAFDELKEDLISRTKIVLNVPAIANFVAECPRVTFVAANQKLCVAEKPPYSLDPNWCEAVTYVPFEDIVRTCETLARDRDAILEREARAYAAIKAIPISKHLASALASLGSRPSASVK